MDDAAFNTRTHQIESMVQEVESLRDPAARAAVMELVKAVMEVHAAGLARILEMENPSLAGMLKDELVSGLLLLHGLHPAPIEERITQALAKLEPFLRHRSAIASLISIENGVVHVRVEGGPPRSGTSLRQAVEDAVYSLAPEAVDVIVDCPSDAIADFVPLSRLVAG